MVVVIIPMLVHPSWNENAFKNALTIQVILAERQRDNNGTRKAFAITCFAPVSVFCSLGARLKNGHSACIHITQIQT